MKMIFFRWNITSRCMPALIAVTVACTFESVRAGVDSSPEFVQLRLTLQQHREYWPGDLPNAMAKRIVDSFNGHGRELRSADVEVIAKHLNEGGRMYKTIYEESHPLVRQEQQETLLLFVKSYIIHGPVDPALRQEALEQATQFLDRMRDEMEETANRHRDAIRAAYQARLDLYGELASDPLSPGLWQPLLPAELAEIQDRWRNEVLRRWEEQMITEEHTVQIRLSAGVTMGRGMNMLLQRMRRPQLPEAEHLYALKREIAERHDEIMNHERRVAGESR